MITTILEFRKYLKLNEFNVHSNEIELFDFYDNTVIYGPYIIDSYLLYDYIYRIDIHFTNGHILRLSDDYTLYLVINHDTILITINEYTKDILINYIYSTYISDYIKQVFGTILNSFDILNERNELDTISKIGQIQKPVTIELDLKHTAHSLERQGRSSKYIKNSDIKETVESATEQIVDAMMSDVINTKDPIWIYNSQNQLNVVGSIVYNKNTDTITFKVITVMFTDNFYNKMNSYKITI